MKKLYLQLKRTLTVFLVCFLIGFHACAFTNVSGSQSGTWNAAGSPYVLTGNVTVPSGQTLIINPGVEVQFTNGNNTVSQLDVAGTLRAQGNASSYINFTGGSFSGGSQRGPITFESTSTNSILQYVNISQLGYAVNNDNTVAIIVNSSSVTISNCNIHNIRGTALSIANSISPVISNNVINTNDNLDIILGIDNVRLLKGNNPLEVGLLSSTMSANDTLVADNIFYRLLASQTVPLSRTLVINPGVEVQFTNGSNTTSQLDVSGTIKAQGTASNFINFTGGAFSGGSQRGPITFENTSTNSILQYVEISNIGYALNSDYTAAIIVGSSSCTISNCNIHNIRGTAISIANAIIPVISNNIINTNDNLDIILGVDNVRLPKGNNSLEVGLLTSTMSTNDTLTADNIFYRLLANLTVPLSRTLVINPGVEVQFTNGNNTISQLDVSGTLKAQGNASNYVNFTGGAFSGGSQRGPITFESTSTNSILQYVNISYLGYALNTDYTAAIIVNSSSCAISNCNIHNIRGTAISIANAISPTISNNLINTNDNLDIILGVDNVRLPKGNNSMEVGLLASTMGANDTLTADNIFYRLLANLTVPLSRTLVINPGVEVQFTNGNNTISQLDVAGTLKAQGNPTNYINFTGGAFSGGSQRGPITFESTSLNSILQYVNISQLGFALNSDYTAAIIVNSSSCIISNCNIQNIRGVAVSIANSVSPTITNNIISGSDNLDVILGLDNIRLLKGNNPLQIGLLTSSMGLNDTLTADNLFYRLLANQTVPLTRTLVMNAGVELQFTNGNNTISQVDVAGTLKANGNASNYINFTGGAFSGGSQRGPITFESTSTNSVLQYVNISNLGYAITSSTTPILIIKSSSCQIMNTIMQNNRGVAVEIMNSASPTFMQSCFYSNLFGAVLSMNGNAKFRNCNFVGNKSGIVNRSVSDLVDASNCWWGDASGPYQMATNPTGVGDSVSSGVIYANYSNQPFNCSAEAGPLPITLLNFRVDLSGDYVNCTWQTSSELNSSQFIVEQSIDGINFTELGKINAAGNSVIVKNYQYIDTRASNGNSYYRLKIVDKDGNFTYSKVIQIYKGKISFTVSPNPVKGKLFITVQQDEAEHVTLQLADMQGRILQRQSQYLQVGITNFPVNTSLLSKGLYLVIIKGKKVESKVFVKE